MSIWKCFVLTMLHCIRCSTVWVCFLMLHVVTQSWCKNQEIQKKKKKMIQNLSECGIWIWMVIFDSFLVNFRTANFRAISPKSFIWCPSSFFDHSLLAESPLQRNVSTIPLLTRRKDLMNLMDSFFKISKKKKS